MYQTQLILEGCSFIGREDLQQFLKSNIEQALNCDVSINIKPAGVGLRVVISSEDSKVGMHSFVATLIRKKFQQDSELYCRIIKSVEVMKNEQNDIAQHSFLGKNAYIRIPSLAAVIALAFRLFYGFVSGFPENLVLDLSMTFIGAFAACWLVIFIIDSFIASS